MKIDDKLSEIFEVAPSSGEVVASVNDASIVPEGNDTVEDLDYQKSRENAYELFTKGKEILELAIRVADSTETPRSIEVAAGLIGQLTAANAQLLELANKHKQIKQPSKSDPASTTTVTNNAIFVGSTADLLAAAMNPALPKDN